MLSGTKGKPNMEVLEQKWTSPQWRNSSIRVRLVLLMGRERKDIRIIRTQVLFSVRANKTLPVARVVYIMNMKNEYWYEMRKKKHKPR